MSIDSINRRLDKLDALHPAGAPRRVIRLIVGEDDETGLPCLKWSDPGFRI